MLPLGVIREEHLERAPLPLDGLRRQVGTNRHGQKFDLRQVIAELAFVLMLDRERLYLPMGSQRPGGVCLQEELGASVGESGVRSHRGCGQGRVLTSKPTSRLPSYVASLWNLTTKRKWLCKYGVPTTEPARSLDPTKPSG